MLKIAFDREFQISKPEKNYAFRPLCIKGKERRLSPPLKITIHFATTTSKTFSDRKKFVLSRIFDGDFTVVCQFSVDDR